MPEATSQTRTRSPRRGLTRSLILFAFIAFFGMYMLRGIPGEVARWKMAAAEDLFFAERFDPAFAMAADAQRWDRDNVFFGTEQARWNRQTDNLSAALESLNATLETANGDKDATAELLIQRADLLQAMDKHTEALADVEKVFELLKLARSPSDENKRYVPQRVNTRAYFIARARAAQQASDKQLGEALEDMRELMRYWDVNLNSTRLHDVSPIGKMQFRVTELGYLDTYAYLRLLNREVGPALHDFNRCIAMCDHLMALAVSLSSDTRYSAEMQSFLYILRDHKAVILYHRGQTHELLQNDAAAIADFQAAKLLGFNKKLGRW